MDYIGIAGMILPSAFSLAGGLYMYKLNRRDKAMDAAKAQHERESRELKEKQEQESKALRNGLCAVLRDRIMQSATYHEERGFIPLRDMENMSLMYQAYHELGGNGLVTKVYEEVLELPHIDKEVSR